MRIDFSCNRVMLSLSGVDAVPTSHAVCGNSFSGYYRCDATSADVRHDYDLGPLSAADKSAIRTLFAAGGAYLFFDSETAGVQVEPNEN